MFVADLHNDLVQRAMIGEDVSKLTKHGHTDIARLIDSCIDLEILVVWVSMTPKNKSAFKEANLMYDKIELLSNQNLSVSIPKSLNQIVENKKNKILSIPISIEGGEAIENSIEKLHHFIERGLLYFGPTWNYSLDWVSSGYDETHNKNKIKNLGLSDFGKEVVYTCNENGVIIDMSHIGEKSFWDIASISSKPFIASHSSVYNFTKHFRNLKDDQLLEIKRVEGLVGINPYPFFIDNSFKKKEEEFIKKYKKNLDSIGIKENNKTAAWISKQHYLQNLLKDIVPSFDTFIDHIEYVINLIGVDYVGIGSDYDGLDCLPHGWLDCMDHHKIANYLDKRGYSSKDIEKVMGNNFLRVISNY
ncbi:dipeptidase [Alphaproteobacteria bacterium]|nr:dipeptidase [Alphaproteobacteria bacterium]